MKEFISINIGQAGTQIGNSCWEAYCKEFGIEKDGNFSQEITNNQTSNFSFQENFQNFFYETSQGNKIARSIFLDLDPLPLNQIRLGEYKNLFHPDFFISGQEDSGGICNKALNSLGKENLESILEKVKKMAENCENLEGFIFSNSISGGTGSGLTSLLLEAISNEFNKKSKTGFTLFPSKNKSNASYFSFETCNALLSCQQLINLLDLCFVLDNDSLYSLCSKKLNLENPSYLNMNRLIAQLVSSIMTHDRLNNSNCLSFSDLKHSLIPFPKIHFINSHFSGFFPANMNSFEELSLKNLLENVFQEKENSFASINQKNGMYISYSLLFRGEMMPKDINFAYADLKENLNNYGSFHEFSSNVIKKGLNPLPPVWIPEGDLAKTQKNIVLLSNTTSSKEIFGRIKDNFDSLNGKESFINLYKAEGVGEDFEQAREEIINIEQDYKELEILTESDEEDF